MYLKPNNLGLRQFSLIARADGAIDLRITWNPCPIFYKNIIFYNHTAIK